jgi:succinate dehydrogenase / fumarate reductase iron-sulfur subunit
MTSSAVSGSQAPRAGQQGGGKAVPDGHLPVTELLSDRPAAPSPFGDDLTFPLPVSDLVYLHPSENPWAARH